MYAMATESEGLTLGFTPVLPVTDILPVTSAVSTVDPAGGGSSLIVTSKIMHCTVGSIGAVGNLFVIIVILNSKSMRTRSTNILITLQSFIDLMATIFIIINNSMEEKLTMKDDSIASEIYCRLWLMRLPVWGFMTMSTYNLVSIGIERYIAVVWPFKASKDMVKRNIGWIILFEFTFGFFPHYAINTPTSTIKDGFCVYMGNVESPSLQIALLSIILVEQFFIPLSLLLFMYSHMAIVLGRQMLKSDAKSYLDDNHTSSARDTRMKNAQNNMLQTCVLVTLFFIICWTPICSYFYIYRVHSAISLTTFLGHALFHC